MRRDVNGHVILPPVLSPLARRILETGESLGCFIVINTCEYYRRGGWKLTYGIVTGLVIGTVDDLPHRAMLVGR